MLIAAEKEKLPIVEEGMYDAVCTGIIDLGNQVNETYKNVSRKVRLVFELIGETYEMNDETKARQVAKEFTLSLSEKANLRSFLKTWRGKDFTADELSGFDLKSVLGKPGQLLIIHETSKKGNTYAAIDSLIPLGKGRTVAASLSRQVFFDMDDPDTYGEYEMFPDFLKEKISKAENFGDTGLTYGESLDEDEEDETVRFAKPAKAAAPAKAPAPVKKAATVQKAAPAENVPEINPEDDLNFDTVAA